VVRALFTRAIYRNLPLLVLQKTENTSGKPHQLVTTPEQSRMATLHLTKRKAILKTQENALNLVQELIHSSKSHSVHQGSRRIWGSNGTHRPVELAKTESSPEHNPLCIHAHTITTSGQALLILVAHDHKILFSSVLLNTRNENDTDQNTPHKKPDQNMPNWIKTCSAQNSSHPRTYLPPYTDAKNYPDKTGSNWKTPEHVPKIYITVHESQKHISSPRDCWYSDVTRSRFHEELAETFRLLHFRVDQQIARSDSEAESSNSHSRSTIVSANISLSVIHHPSI
jgi:hypothetical protein